MRRIAIAMAMLGLAGWFAAACGGAPTGSGPGLPTDAGVDDATGDGQTADGGPDGGGGVHQRQLYYPTSATGRSESDQFRAVITVGSPGFGGVVQGPEHRAIVQPVSP
ncbi:MAG: hypothetical protein ABEL76_14100 [Bradymonadaceae bacterium]